MGCRSCLINGDLGRMHRHSIVPKGRGTCTSVYPAPVQREELSDLLVAAHCRPSTPKSQCADIMVRGSGDVRCDNKVREVLPLPLPLISALQHVCMG
jgi:hypothetical protein